MLSRENNVVKSGSYLIPVNNPAPDFSATLSDGTNLTLSALHGRRVVLVFYPGDNTPVCTAQLCAFRDDWTEFQKLDALVYGVNPATADKHARFSEKYQFPFPLLVDTGGQIAAAYGCRAWFGMIRRAVYVIDRHGRIAYARRGNPATSEIRRVLETLQDQQDQAVDAE